jgi:hypothetical protein
MIFVSCFKWVWFIIELLGEFRNRDQPEIFLPYPAASFDSGDAEVTFCQPFICRLYDIIRDSRRSDGMYFISEWFQEIDPDLTI